MKAWVLTQERNEYDQYGDYFIAAFKEKPSKAKLEKAILGDDEDYFTDCQYKLPKTKVLDHILSGGGWCDLMPHERFCYKLQEIELL